MKRPKLEILGCSEVRWTQSGKIRLDNMTFLYSGREQDHKRGVGIFLVHVQQLHFLDIGQYLIKLL